MQMQPKKWKPWFFAAKPLIGVWLMVNMSPNIWERNWLIKGHLVNIICNTCSILWKENKNLLENVRRKFCGISIFICLQQNVPQQKKRRHPNPSLNWFTLDEPKCNYRSILFYNIWFPIKNVTKEVKRMKEMKWGGRWQIPDEKSPKISLQPSALQMQTSTWARCS